MVTRRWKSLNTSLSEYAVVLVPFRCSQYLLSCNWFPGIVPGCMPPYLPFRQTVPERSGSWTISRLKKSYQSKFLVLGKICCSYWFPPVNSILRSNMEEWFLFSNIQKIQWHNKSLWVATQRDLLSKLYKINSTFLHMSRLLISIACWRHSDPLRF